MGSFILGQGVSRKKRPFSKLLYNIQYILELFDRHIWKHGKEITILHHLLYTIYIHKDKLTCYVCVISMRACVALYNIIQDIYEEDDGGKYKKKDWNRRTVGRVFRETRCSCFFSIYCTQKYTIRTAGVNCLKDFWEQAQSYIYTNETTPATPQHIDPPLVYPLKYRAIYSIRPPPTEGTTLQQFPILFTC